MQGSGKPGKKEDWLREDGSRAQVAAVDSPQEDGVGPTWLTKQEGDTIDTLSKEGGVAQLYVGWHRLVNLSETDDVDRDPLRLCKFLLKECIMKGVRLHHPARAVRISRDNDGHMSAVRVHHDSGADHKIPCTRLLLAAGAWTPAVFATLFAEANTAIPVSALAGHSLVVRSPRWTQEMEQKGCHAIFTSMSNGLSPEAFSRTGGEIWLGGVNDPDAALPERATDAAVDPASIDKLMDVARQLLGREGEADDLEVVREGVCFRPVTRSGQPILARIPDEELGGIGTRQAPDGGVFIAAGHGPWGISLSLGTGRCVAEMMEGGVESADVGQLGMR